MSGIESVRGLGIRRKSEVPGMGQKAIQSIGQPMVKSRCCMKTRKDQGAYCPKGACARYSPGMELKDEAAGCGRITATRKHGGMLQEKM